MKKEEMDQIQRDNNEIFIKKIKEAGWDTTAWETLFDHHMPDTHARIDQLVTAVEALAVAVNGATFIRITAELANTVRAEVLRDQVKAFKRKIGYRSPSTPPDELGA